LKIGDVFGQVVVDGVGVRYRRRGVVLEFFPDISKRHLKGEHSGVYIKETFLPVLKAGRNVIHMMRETVPLRESPPVSGLGELIKGPKLKNLWFLLQSPYTELVMKNLLEADRAYLGYVYPIILQEGDQEFAHRDPQVACSEEMGVQCDLCHEVGLGPFYQEEVTPLHIQAISRTSHKEPSTDRASCHW
jgi:hypothetical protein